MIVKDLIKLLEQEDPDALVVIQKDSEGNDYSPLSLIDAGGYVADNSWSGQACLLELTQDARDQGFTEEDVSEDAVKALFLVPVN